MLVGGGELHDRWETLVSGAAPLSRAIQRFTQISQQMVDAAPPADAVLPDLADRSRARVLVAHNAAFDRRVLRQAFARADLRGPTRRSLCTVALARRFAPLVRQRRLAALADALGIEVETTHRALADAETCARVFCALFGAAVRERRDGRRRARGALAAAPAPAAARAGARSRAARSSATSPTRPRCPTRRASTSSATPPARSSTSASPSRCAHARARTSRRRRPPRAGPTRRRSSTTAARARSSARSCSSTASSASCARRATRSTSTTTRTSTCAAAWTSPTPCSRSRASRPPGAR